MIHGNEEEEDCFKCYKAHWNFAHKLIVRSEKKSTNIDNINWALQNVLQGLICVCNDYLTIIFMSLPLLKTVCYVVPHLLFLCIPNKQTQLCDSNRINTLLMAVSTTLSEFN